MKRDCTLGVLFLILVLYTTAAFSAVPHLIKSIPPDGATDVPLHQGKIVLYFDTNMKMGSWSLMTSSDNPFPPLLPIEEPWVDPLTFEFNIKPLRPNTLYAIQLNGKKRKGFLAADDAAPLSIATITFTTATSASPEKAILPQKSQMKKEGLPKLQPTWPEKQLPGRVSQISPGWQFEVTRSIGMEGTEAYQTGFEAPFRVFQKVVFKEEVTKAAENEIQEVSRQIESAQLHSLDPERGQMVKQDLVPPGTQFRIAYSSHGSVLRDGTTGQEIWDTDMVSTFAPALIPKLWPLGRLQKGSQWSYQGDELVRRVGLIDILGGRIDLEVENVYQELSTGLATSAIRGRLQTKVELDDIVLDFDAKVEIDLPLELGVPFMVKFDGVLSGTGTATDERGRSVNYQVQAKGTVLQIAKPATAVIDSVGGSVIEKGNVIDTQGALRIPLTDAEYMDSPVTKKSMGPGSPETSGKIANTLKEANPPVYRYKLYEDVTEEAFTVLVPDGWRTQGGIMQLQQHQIRTVVDGCGKKLYFSIYDPTTQAAITYFPTEIYHTAAPGTSIMSIPTGQVLNGMVQMPQSLTPSQYVQQITFPSSRPNASNVEWGEKKSLTTLANEWNRAFHSGNRIPPQINAESIEVAYDVAGTHFAELWTALITSVQANTSTIWMPDFTVVAGGPMDSVEKIAPVLKAVITSFRMNSTWMAKSIARFEQCTKGVAIGQEKIRAIDRKISERLKQVQKEIHSIDNEIVANKNNTRSVIQEHEHNALMGEDKYEDSGTGKRYIIDMGYERNFTDGETLIQTNDWSFEPPPRYRDMKNISITGD